jgi:hypothetical protein
MTQLTGIFLLGAALALCQAGRITGTVTDDSGAPIAGAIVTAGLRVAVVPGTTGPGGLPLPYPPIGPTDDKGAFEIDNLPAGTFALCVDKFETAVLNPCWWKDQPVMTKVAAGAAVSGVSVVAPTGVIITVRVQDAKGLLSNLANDDVRVGTYHGKSSFIPALVSGRDATGKTMTLAVLPGQALKLALSSSTYALADDKGNALGAGETQIPVAASALPSTSIASLTAPPVLTVQVTGKK